MLLLYQFTHKKKIQGKWHGYIATNNYIYICRWNLLFFFVYYFVEEINAFRWKKCSLRNVYQIHLLLFFLPPPYILMIMLTHGERKMIDEHMFYKLGGYMVLYKPFCGFHSIYGTYQKKKDHAWMEKRIPSIRCKGDRYLFRIYRKNRNII